MENDKIAGVENDANVDASKIKMNPFFKIFTIHNTTIIAIIMSIISVISSNIQDQLDEYETNEQQAEAAYSEFVNDTVELTYRIEDLKFTEVKDSLAYNIEVESINARIDTIQKQASAIDSVKNHDAELLSSTQSKEKTVGWAKSLSEIAVLVSAVALTNKNKFLLYSASILTVICIVLVLVAFIL
jgi:hypothetical protein